ncbi:DgyrCDS6555 [Dimorphilus gyrociliatus]|uniref:UBX domain-containing protein 4 n=1 Tax=Dimorphilus gyrociliatus TaxID=2664684 RepID=A0A7I8VT58_9ANNE|nr:DgyrCDS6555 [Dimorphilus gyrociliatus]
MERLENFILRLSEMGFDVNDSREAWQNGILTVQDAIDWILSGKPRRIQQSATATLKLGQNSGSLNEECNPFSEAAAKPVPNTETFDNTKMDSEEEALESRMHLNDEQRKIKERFEEKQRLEARKKIVEEKRNKRLERERIKRQIDEDRQRKKELAKSPPSTSSVPPPQPCVQTDTNKSKSATSTIQIRFPDNTVKRETFDKDAIFREVIRTVERLGFSSSDHSLVQPFPRKEFESSDQSKTLIELGLYPNGSLVLTKVSRNETKQAVVTTVQSMETEQEQHEEQGQVPEFENYPANDEQANNDEMLDDIVNPGVNIGHFVQYNWGEGHVLNSGGQISNPEQTALQRAAIAAESRSTIHPPPSCLARPKKLFYQPISYQKLLIRTICKRLVENYASVYSLQNLPPALASSLIEELKSKNLLRAKILQKFVPCRLTELNLECYAYLTNELLQSLKYHVHLEILNLNSGAYMTDVGLQVLSYLKHLRSLSIANNKQITDGFVPTLKNFTQLESLNVEGTSISDVGVEQMAGFGLRALRELNMARTNVTEECLQLVATGLTAVTSLNVEGTKVNALWGTAEMAERLEDLNISNCAVSTDSLQHLKQCGHLISLNLRGTNIKTEVGLNHLKGK